MTDRRDFVYRPRPEAFHDVVESIDHDEGTPSTRPSDSRTLNQPSRPKHKRPSTRPGVPDHRSPAVPPKNVKFNPVEQGPSPRQHLQHPPPSIIVRQQQHQQVSRPQNSGMKRKRDDIPPRFMASQLGLPRHRGRGPFQTDDSDNENDTGYRIPTTPRRRDSDLWSSSDRSSVLRSRRKQETANNRAKRAADKKRGRSTDILLKSPVYTSRSEDESPERAPIKRGYESHEPAPKRRRFESPEPASTRRRYEAHEPAPTRGRHEALEPAPTRRRYEAPEPAPTRRRYEAPEPAPTRRRHEAPEPAPTRRRHRSLSPLNRQEFAPAEPELTAEERQQAKAAKAKATRARNKQLKEEQEKREREERKQHAAASRLISLEAAAQRLQGSPNGGLQGATEGGIYGDATRPLLEQGAKERREEEEAAKVARKHRREEEARARIEEERIRREESAERKEEAAAAQREARRRQEDEAKARLDKARDEARQRNLEKKRADNAAAEEAKQAKITAERDEKEHRRAQAIILRDKLKQNKLDLAPAKKVSSTQPRAISEPIDDDDAVMNDDPFDVGNSGVAEANEAWDDVNPDTGTTRPDDQVTDAPASTQIEAPMDVDNGPTIDLVSALEEEVESAAMDGVGMSLTQATTVYPAGSTSQQGILNPPQPTTSARELDLEDRRKNLAEEKRGASRPKLRRPVGQNLGPIDQNLGEPEETPILPQLESPRTQPTIERSAGRSNTDAFRNVFTKRAPKASKRSNAPEPVNMMDDVQSLDALRQAAEDEVAAKREKREKALDKRARAGHKKKIRDQNPDWTEAQVEAEVEKKMAQRSMNRARRIPSQSQSQSQRDNQSSSYQAAQSYPDEDEVEYGNDYSNPEASSPASNPAPRRKTAKDSNNIAYRNASMALPYNGPIIYSDDSESEEESDDEEGADGQELIEEGGSDAESEHADPTALEMDSNDDGDSEDSDISHQGVELKWTYLYYVRMSEKVQDREEPKIGTLATFASLEDANLWAEKYIRKSPQKSFNIAIPKDSQLCGNVTTKDDKVIEVYVQKERRLMQSLPEVVREQCLKAASPKKVYFVQQLVQTWPKEDEEREGNPVTKFNIRYVTYNLSFANQRCHDLFLQATEPSHNDPMAHEKWYNELKPVIDDLLKKAQWVDVDTASERMLLGLDDDYAEVRTPWIRNWVWVEERAVEGPLN